MPNRCGRWCRGRGLRFDSSVVRSDLDCRRQRRERRPTLTLEDVAVVESGGENLDQDLICIRLRCNQRCKDSESGGNSSPASEKRRGGSGRPQMRFGQKFTFIRRWHRQILNLDRVPGLGAGLPLVTGSFDEDESLHLFRHSSASSMRWAFPCTSI